MNVAFDADGLDQRLRWHCEPARWEIDRARRCLKIAPAGGTDFWQRTHYGFEADNGHFLFVDAVDDFVMTTHVRFHPVHQYDQAGLMIRLSSACWLKTSVEYEPGGPSRLGAVVTNGGYSDWSTQEFAGDRTDTWLRIRREATDYIVDASTDGRAWQQIRMAHLHDDRPHAAVACGLYACSPKVAGFVAEFDVLSIEAGRVSLGA